MTLPREERIQLLKDQMKDWHTKLGPLIFDDENIERNISYIVEYTYGILQPAQKLQKEFRIKDDS